MTLQVSQPSRGFTLLELIVALSIFAMMAAMAYSGLNNIITARIRIDEKADALIALQRTFAFLSRDILQTINRPVREAYGGDSHLPPLIGNEVGENLLELTRTGWRNPAGFPRSNLQRVAWGLSEGKLQRAYWTAIDKAQDTPAIKQTMLENVAEMELRYLDQDGEWKNSWPSTIAVAGQDNEFPPPRAVEVTIEHKEFGKIQRIFPVPGAVTKDKGS